MSNPTWKVIRKNKSYFLTVTSQEVICYTRDANDLAGEYNIPDKHVSRCSHADFRAGELQDWALVYMGDEVMMEALTYVYESGTTADEARLNSRTMSHWQLLPFDLMLAEDAKEADDDGFSRFALGKDGATEATLNDGTHLSIPFDSQHAILTKPNREQRTIAIPPKVMSLIAYADHFYLSGSQAIVISANGTITYTTARDAAKFRFGSLFTTGNLFRAGRRIILEYRADENSASDVFELTGRRGYLRLHPTRGIIGWQAG